MKTSLVLTPANQEELDSILEKQNAITDFPFADIIVAVEVDSGIEVRPVDKNITVPKEISFAKKANIARQLVPDDTDILLFVKNAEILTKEFLENRTKAYEIEKVIGAVGKLYQPDEETQKALEEKLLSILNISPDDLASRCKLEDGKFRVLDHNNFSTTVDLWDKIGGLPQSTDPVSEYCIRGQALGYGLLPQPE